MLAGCLLMSDLGLPTIEDKYGRDPLATDLYTVGGKRVRTAVSVISLPR